MIGPKPLNLKWLCGEFVRREGAGAWHTGCCRRDGQHDRARNGVVLGRGRFRAGREPDDTGALGTSMKHHATRELFGYWNALRGARRAPERVDIEPTAIRSVLADTFMLEVDVARGFPIRLAGTRVNGLLDAEQKGRDFLALWQPAERRNVAAVLMTVADGACPVVAGAVASPVARETAAFELIFLPLRHNGKTHSRILGLIKPLEAPAWLGLLPIGPLSLQSLRIVEARETPQPLAVGAETGLSPMHFADPTPTMRPYLRVIQGGR